MIVKYYLVAVSVTDVIDIVCVYMCLTAPVVAYTGGSQA